MRAAIHIAAKDLKLLLRDRMGFFFVFIFPLMTSLFFGTIFGGGGGDDGYKGMPIAVVDEDRTQQSARFAASLSENGDFAVQRVETRELAADLVRHGKRTAFVVVPAGYGEASSSFMRGQPMELVVGVDPSRKAEAGMIRGLLTARAFRRVQEVFSDPAQGQAIAADSLRRVRQSTDIPEEQRQVLEPFLVSLQTFLDKMPRASAAATSPVADSARGGFNPVHIEEVAVVAAGKPMPSSYTMSFPQGMVWGLIGCAASFGIALVVERTRRTLTRLQAAPLHDWQIIAGKALACLIAMVSIQAVLIAIAIAGFGVRPVSPLLLVAGIGCCSAGFVGIMMLLSVLGRTEAAAGGIGWAAMMVMAMAGGGMVPLMFMPRWMQPISSASPVKWAMLAIEGPLWRGFSMQEMLMPCGILLAIGCAGLLLGSLLFRRIQIV